MKTCTKCKEERPDSEFHKRASEKDGIAGICKICTKAYKAKQRETIAEAKAEVRRRLGISGGLSGAPYTVRKARTIGKLSPNIKAVLFKAQGGICPCCNRPLGKRYHVDHIMPLALGGLNTDDNVQLLRASCNIEKGASHPDEFIERRKRQRESRKKRLLRFGATT